MDKSPMLSQGHRLSGDEPMLGWDKAKTVKPCPRCGKNAKRDMLSFGELEIPVYVCKCVSNVDYNFLIIGFLSNLLADPLNIGGHDADQT